SVVQKRNPWRVAAPALVHPCGVEAADSTIDKADQGGYGCAFNLHQEHFAAGFRQADDLGHELDAARVTEDVLAVHIRFNSLPAVDLFDLIGRGREPAH